MWWFIVVALVAVAVLAYTIHAPGEEEVNESNPPHELFSHDWTFQMDCDLCKDKYNLTVPRENVLMFANPTDTEVKVTVSSADEPKDGQYLQYRVDGDQMTLSSPGGEDVFIISLDEPTIRILHVEQAIGEPFIWPLVKA